MIINWIQILVNDLASVYVIKSTLYFHIIAFVTFKLSHLLHKLWLLF